MQKYYWAGFTDGKLYFVYQYAHPGVKQSLYGEAAIYKTKKQAQSYFEDVRKIEIKEVTPHMKRIRNKEKKISKHWRGK